jgi:hypothetical protein
MVCREPRAQAYVDYLRTVAAAAHLRGDEELRDAVRDAAGANARIVLYGDWSVLRVLAAFKNNRPEDAK